MGAGQEGHVRVSVLVSGRLLPCCLYNSWFPSPGWSEVHEWWNSSLWSSIDGGIIGSEGYRLKGAVGARGILGEGSLFRFMAFLPDVEAK